MSHDYVNDLFGVFRKGRKTKFTDVENRAKQLMNAVYKNKISHDEFYEGFTKVIKEFNDLSGNVIDEDTPLWLNSFGANVFLRWRNWYFLRKMHAEQPEKFNTPDLEAQYREIEVMNYDNWLRDKIKYCLENL